MRPLVLILAITTVTFAGTTAYYARELAAARSQPPAAADLTTRAKVLPTPYAATTPAHLPAPAQARTVVQGTRVDPGGVGILGPAPMSEADMKRMQAEYHQQMIERLVDPQARDELRAEHRMMLRHLYPRVDKYLGLSSEEYTQFMNLLADQQIAMQEKMSRCALDPECAEQGLRFNEEDSQSVVAKMLGPERAQKFDTYRNTMGEREAVTQLRSRLSDNSRLAEDSAEGLIAALADERSAMHREAAARGEGMFGFGMGAGTLFAPSEGSFESRYEAAQQNSQRMRARAAQFLNTEQMRAFNEMQDELLVTLRAQLRRKDSAPGAQAAAISGAAISGVVIGERPD